MSEVLFIEGGRVIDPAGGVDGPRTVVVRDGKIAEVGERVERPRDARAIDARGTWGTSATRASRARTCTRSRSSARGSASAGPPP